MRSSLLLCCLTFVILSSDVFSQYYLTIISGGKNKNTQDDILSAAEDIEEAVLKGIKLDLTKMNSSYSPDSVHGINNTFFSLYSKLKADGMAVLMVIGPWLKINSNPELSSFDAYYPDKLTIDYLYNFLLYLKCEKSFIFVFTPPGTSLPDMPDAVNWKNLNINGKYLIIFNSSQPDLDDFVSAIEDTFSDLASESEKLVEQRKPLLVSDWVRFIGAAGAKYGLELKIYPAGEAKVPYMKLKED